MRLALTSATAVQEYNSADEVLITTYIGQEPAKKGSQSYSFDVRFSQLTQVITLILLLLSAFLRL